MVVSSAVAGRKNSKLTGEICIRMLLVFIWFISESVEPFRRKIQPEEIWLYKNPPTDSYVPSVALMTVATVVPLFVFFVVSLVVSKEKADLIEAGLGISLSLGITAVLTNLVKITVGRPRPDFFWRCFPDGKVNDEMICTGSQSVIREGLKSFPSGHSSVAFATLGYTAFYLAGKLQCFNVQGRGQSWRFCLFVTPLTMALVIALSRTCDYHHHWQDVLVGSLLGLFLAYVSYRQYFPSLGSVNCDRAYSFMTSGSDLVRPFHEGLIMVKSV